jgi:hypothetical protein
MPVGRQHYGGVAMAVAIGPGDFDEALDFDAGQVFARPHLAIAYALRRPILREYERRPHQPDYILNNQNMNILLWSETGYRFVKR